MPLGHLMLGLMGAIAAFAGTLAAGLSIWMAALAYVVVGNLCVAISVVLQVLADRGRRPPRRRTPRRKGVGVRPLRVPH